MFSGSLLNKYAGPGTFLPHMMPTQQLTDQFAMRNYQQQSQAASLGVAHDNDPRVAASLLGFRSVFTKAAPTELNREQASNMAGMINSPFAKTMMGMLMGAENVEAMFHGSKGDVSALQGQLSRIGYFRKDPSGTGRPDAESLMNYTRSMYAHMYEPQGNLEEIETEARSTDKKVREAGRERLKKAAKREDVTVVDDDELVSRFESMEDAPKRVEALYKKYVQGGTATDTKQQAQELVKLDRAVQASGQLKENEATVGGLVNQANRVPVNEMHGFMAGQVGRITENMFQRGLLPQAVGAMSAADRARVINETPMDAETIQRLTRDMAKRDFEDRNNSSEKAREYRGLTTDRERQEFINKNAGDYKTTLENTRKEIEKTATGASGAMSATDLDKLKGFDAMASNVDAKRSVEAIKKYTGAVAAIRDIFGDNGNPNAPLPALLAALEGLTGGAVGSMKPQKIEATLRQMQTAAKEAGIGFEQMAAMSTQMDGMSQALGLTPADSLRLKADQMSAIKVMQDTGAFSAPTYGQVDKGTGAAKVGELIARGAASKTSRAMAALEGIYQADPQRFKGQELEKALEAYRNNEGDGTYEYNGEKKNIRDIMGRLGPAAAEHLLTSSGGRREEFIAQINNPNVMRYSNEMFGFLAQKAEATRDISLGDAQFRAQNKLEKKTNLFAGMDHQSRTGLSRQVSDVMSRMIVDTSGMQDQGEQITKIQNELETELTKEFEKTMPPAAAAAKAKEAAGALSSRDDIFEFIGGANAVLAGNTGGMQLSEFHQYHGQGRDAKIAKESSEQGKRAERRANVVMGHEGSIMAKGSDYLMDIGIRNESFNPDEFLKSIAGVTTDNEVLRRYATQELKGGMDVVADLRRESFVGKSEVAKAKEDAKTGDPAALKKIREFAGLAATDNEGKYTTEIVDQATAEKLRDEQITKATSDNAALLQQYKKYGGSTPVTAEQLGTEEYKNARATMVNELRNNQTFMADMQRQGLGSNRVSLGEAFARADNAVGSAKAGMDDAARDTDKIQAAMFYGNNEDVLRAGVFAGFRSLDRRHGASLTEAQQNEIMAAVSDTSESGAARLKTALKPLEGNEKAYQEAMKTFGAFQSGKPLAIGDTLGISKVPDQEFEKQLTQQLEARGLSPDAAKDVKAKVEQQREADKKTDAPKTEEEKKVAELKRVEAALTDEYIKKGVNPEVAATQAKSDAAGVMAKTEAAVKEADRATQKVNTLEVNAQTVVIKSGKVEGGGSAGGATAAGSDEKTAPEEPKNLVQKAGAALNTAAGFVSNLLPPGMADKAKELGAAALSGLFPAAAQGDKPKPDAQAEPEKTAPPPPAPEPEKVARANSEQLRHDTGNTPAAPKANQDPEIAAEIAAQVSAAQGKTEEATGTTSAPAAKETEQTAAEATLAAEENVPPSMLDAVNEAIQSPEGQAVLSGASALYEKYAPNFLKDKISKALPNYMEPDERAEAMGEKPSDLEMLLGKEIPSLSGGGDPEMAEHARQSKDAPFKDLGFEIGKTVDSESVVENDELVKDSIKTTSAAEVTGSPMQQIMYGLSKGYLPTQTYKKGDVVGLHTAVEMDELVTDQRLTDLPEELKKDAARYQEARKDERATEAVEKTPAHDEQMRLQEHYLHWQDKLSKATDPMDREEAQRGVDGTLKLLGEHDAARAAGVDTAGGIKRDQHAQTINGKTVKNEDVDRHVRLIKEKAAKDPNSILSPEIRKRQEKLATADTIKAMNDYALYKNRGISSANVTPAAAAAATQAAEPAAHGPATADAVTQQPLSTTVAESAPQAGGGVSAANRVQAMPADAIMGQASAGGSSGSTASSGGGATGGMTINGTLTLSGLQEAIISAQGAQVMQTEGGAPVVIDPAMTPRAAAAPRTA
ncbi:MAG: hypothetical protein EBZ69_00640 [Alphaproteobacteria bacterium]|nr:hypothetical protein [Alphaproteobacteria bacterium]